MQNDVLIFNAYDAGTKDNVFLNKFQLPRDVVIHISYITERYDLFLFGETENEYQVWHVDIASFQEREIDGDKPNQGGKSAVDSNVSSVEPNNGPVLQ